MRVEGKRKGSVKCDIIIGHRKHRQGERKLYSLIDMQILKQYGRLKSKGNLFKV